jgi:hypothetical protein
MSAGMQCTCLLRHADKAKPCEWVQAYTDTRCSHRGIASGCDRTKKESLGMSDGQPWSGESYNDESRVWSGFTLLPPRIVARGRSMRGVVYVWSSVDKRLNCVSADEWQPKTHESWSRLCLRIDFHLSLCFQLQEELSIRSNRLMVCVLTSLAFLRQRWYWLSGFSIVCIGTLDPMSIDSVVA